MNTPNRKSFRLNIDIIVCTICRLSCRSGRNLSATSISDVFDAATAILQIEHGLA